MQSHRYPCLSIFLQEFDNNPASKLYIRVHRSHWYVKYQLQRYHYALGLVHAKINPGIGAFFTMYPSVYKWRVLIAHGSKYTEWKEVLKDFNMQACMSSKYLFILQKGLASGASCNRNQRYSWELMLMDVKTFVKLKAIHMTIPRKFDISHGSMSFMQQEWCNIKLHDGFDTKSFSAMMSWHWRVHWTGVMATVQDE